MRRLIAIAGAIVLLIAQGPRAHAAPQPYQGFPAVDLYVNGRYVQNDVPPVIIDGRTMVPLRAISEALGEKIWWDGSLPAVAVGDAPVIAGADVPDGAIALVQEVASEQWTRVCSQFGVGADIPFIWVFGNRETWRQRIVDLMPEGRDIDTITRRVSGLGGSQVSILVEEADRDEVKLALSHEFVHRILNDVSWASEAWINEGIAEYVSMRASGLESSTSAGSDLWHEARRQVLSRVLDNSLHPLVKSHETVFDELEDYPNYPQSLLAVDFLLANHGGLDAYLRYAGLIREDKEHSDAFLEAFGVSGEEFEEAFMGYLAEEAAREPGEITLEFSLPDGIRAHLVAFPPTATEARGWRIDGMKSVQVTVVKKDEKWEPTVEGARGLGSRYVAKGAAEYLSIYFNYTAEVTVNGKVVSQQAFLMGVDQYGWFYAGGTLLFKDDSREVLDGAQTGVAVLSGIKPKP